MTNIIGVSGFARSGKDSFASFLLPLGWRRFAFADALKSAAYSLDPIVENLDGTGVCRVSWLVDNVGWEEAKVSPDVRRLLQRLGTEVGREILGPNVWVDLLDRRIKIEAPALAIITDVRFPNEVEWLLDNGGTFVRVERPGVGPANDHASEDALSEYEPHYLVENSGDLNDLADSARLIHEELTVLHGQR